MFSSEGVRLLICNDMGIADQGNAHFHYCLCFMRAEILCVPT